MADTVDIDTYRLYSDLGPNDWGEFKLGQSELTKLSMQKRSRVIYIKFLI